MEPDDDLERVDEAIGASLRRHAGELTGPIDTSTPWVEVERRARTRRRWRLAAASVGTAAAATVIVVGFLAVSGDDREVLRAPATQPGGPALTTTAPAVTTTTVPSPAIVPSTTIVSSTASDLTPPPTTTVATAPSTSADPPDPPASVTSYTSTGGSIDVRLGGSAISLDGSPVPTPGWTVQIDDDGPDRVRVRFARDDQRSEIRVDLTSDGRLEPRITEG